MNTLYTISTGGCLDGFYLDYIINDLSKVDALARKFFDSVVNYSNKRTYLHCEYDLKEAEIKIYYKDFYTKEVVQQTFDFVEVGELL